MGLKQWRTIKVGGEEGGGDLLLIGANSSACRLATTPIRYKSHMEDGDYMPYDFLIPLKVWHSSWSNEK